jgi:MFS superfamily sulfate permease-like transporter
MAAGFGLPIQYVDVPGNLLDSLRLSTPAVVTGILTPGLLFSAAALAFIASAETLLSAAAVDRMQNIVRTDYDRELTAQGVGNMVCGFLGALPMTGVIVRSSANVAAGATSRWSAVMHGVWLLAFLAFLPSLLRMIPTASLGAILVFTGYKLMDVRNIRHLAAYGRMQVAIYAATVVTIVCADLLTGVLAGIGLSIAYLIYKITHLEIRLEQHGRRADLHLLGAATFIKMPKLAATLEALPKDAEVHMHIERLAYIDHACLDLMTNWRSRHEADGGTVFVEWDGLRSRYALLGHSPALKPAMSERAVHAP